MSSDRGPDGGAVVNGAAVFDYDRLPYLSLPIAYTQPNHLAALAHLCGQPAPDAERARVLEFGCASGGNLIPLAARFPQAQFLGIDLSARQIAGGQHRITALGLTNIALRAADAGSVDLLPDSADLVICHGLYSWVPLAVQDGILARIGRCLAPQGVAAISYNVLPGWHLRQPVRDILLAHAGSDGTPQERVARARAMLSILSEAGGADAYGGVLRDEAQRMARMPSSYLLGEFLAPDNHPESFRDMTRRAAAAGLQHLCEADFDASARALLNPQARRHLTELAGTDRHAGAQLLDFLSGRPFRRSIFVKARPGEGLSPLQTQAEPRHIRGLHLAAKLLPDRGRSDGGVFAFTDRRGRTLATRVASIGAALDQLSGAYPGTVAASDLLDAAGAQAPRVAKALFDLVLSERAVLSSMPVSVGTAADMRPLVSASARAEAALGLPFVTNLHHVAVHLPELGSAIVAQLDGTRDHAQLTDWLQRALRDGRVRAAPDQSEPADPATSVNETLRFLADSAVLLPAGC